MKRYVFIFLWMYLLSAAIPIQAANVSVQVAVEVQQKEIRNNRTKAIAALISLIGLGAGTLGIYAFMKKRLYEDNSSQTPPPPPPLPSTTYKPKKLPIVETISQTDKKGDRLKPGNKGNSPSDTITLEAIQKVQLKKTEHPKKDSLEPISELDAKMLKSGLNRGNVYPNGEPETQV